MSMLKTFWYYISSAGVKPELSFPVQKRVMLSNQLALIIGLIALVFSLLLLLRPGASALPTFIMLIIVSSIYFINRAGLIHFSRFLVCIIPVAGVLFLNLSTKINIPEKISMIHYISPRMLIAGMISLPLTLFTIDEKRFLYCSLFFPLGTTLFFEEINQLFNVSSSSLGIAQNYQATLFEDIILLTTLLLLAFLFLLNLNKQYEQINKKLLQEAEAKHESMYKSEQELKASLKQVEEVRREDEQRIWSTKGIAGIGQILRDNQSKDIYAVVIGYIVNFIEANQGGIYISSIEEDIDILSLRGSYAYGRKKYQDKQIEAGEGLLGQCYLEGTTTHLTEIPENYIEITSGLGEATPNALVLVPLKLHEKVEGVLELATFDAFEGHQIRFLEKIAESLALFIANKRNNENTEKLLQEAKNASDTQRQQEQVLRKNFDELHSIKEEMEKKERHYLEVIDQLKAQLADKTA